MNNKKNKKIITVLDINGYTVKKSDLDVAVLKDIKTQLTVTPKINTDYNIADDNSFQVFSETDTHITTPRFFGVNYFKTFKNIALKNNLEKNNLDSIKKSDDKNKINITFKGGLRDYQSKIINTCTPIIVSQGGGIMSLYCGAGKTCIAIYMSCKFKLKTLIIVHKTFLQNQWYDRIKTFTDAKIGIIRQNKVDIENKDIVIAMLQSLCSRDYGDIFKQFSFVIFDEVHHLGAKVFSQVMFKTGAKYVLGLSATPTRSDGLTKVINWSLGDIIYKLDREKEHRVLVKIFKYDSSHKLYTEKKRFFNQRLRPDIQKMLTNMHKIDCRDKFIINVINSLRSQDERKILVLSGRLEHLYKLKKELDDILAIEVTNNILVQDEIKTALYVGGMKEYELVDSALADIIFATYEMAQEGLDIDKLNCLVLATPKKDIVQSLGRIMRKPIKDGDIYPLVVDIVDKMPVFANWAVIRERFYKKNNYNVNNYHVWNDGCISIKEYLKMNKVEVANNSSVEDVKKSYICYKLGDETYEFMKDMNQLEEFECEYENDLDKIFGE